MTILVRRKVGEDGTYEVVTGHMRLRTQLDLQGRAEVVDIETRDLLTVHQVGGSLLVLTESGQQKLESAAGAVIDLVRGQKG
ncbi:hypothetical protein ACQUKI_20885 [Ralstonia pseudosolanacearum]